MATSGVPVPSLEIQTVGEKNRLQKPMVQKIRRDRINGSIEQLKLLQEKEFQRHQPNSKLEKADVLEMTVSYLKCSQNFTVSILASKSYSSRLKETLQFLAIHSTDSKTQSKLLRHFQKPLGDDRHMHHSDPHSAPQGITQEGNIKANLQTLEALRRGHAVEQDAQNL
ncbi:transcription factor HES-5-like [Rhineura floridana]|uniref:transcription factor HES-5-like n=1 Tax=Rhineura floridana TaxID=261503 RepID=UPI002AC82799|nr:transcription factor HES-5-like [Rhineura floridana]